MTRLDRRSSIARLENLAAVAAQSVLSEIEECSGGQLVPTPLEMLLTKMGVQISKLAESERLRRLGFKGFAAELDNQTSLFPETEKRYEVSVVGNEDGFARRFTLAHELAHIVLYTRFKKDEARLNPAEREIVCDKAAARILVPDQLSVWFEKEKPNLHVTLSEIERLAGKLRVNISVLISRLGELVDICNGAFTVAMEYSRIHHTNIAPRIKSRCLPHSWYLPINKRLTSLGLGKLARAFFDATPFQELRESISIILWSYDLRRHAEINLPVTYKCYQVADNTKGVRYNRRHMLVILDADLNSSSVDKQSGTRVQPM